MPSVLEVLSLIKLSENLLRTEDGTGCGFGFIDISYARSPTKTHSLVAILINDAEDHRALNLFAGVK